MTQMLYVEKILDNRVQGSYVVKITSVGKNEQLNGSTMTSR